MNQSNLTPAYTPKSTNNSTQALIFLLAILILLILAVLLGSISAKQVCQLRMLLTRVVFQCLEKSRSPLRVQKLLFLWSIMAQCMLSLQGKLMLGSNYNSSMVRLCQANFMECSNRRLNFNYKYLCRALLSSISLSTRLNSSHSSAALLSPLSTLEVQPISTANSTTPGNIINYNHSIHQKSIVCVLIIIAIKLMSETEALRSTILQEADTYGSKRRFGLFSSPISTAIGDDGQYKTRLHPKNEQGKPQTDARGIYTNPPRSGQLNKSYFTGINSLASGEVKDEYIDPARKLLQIENQNFYKSYHKEAMFKPASGTKELYQPAYEFKEENNPEKNPKRNRDAEGKVKIQPRNFYSNQQSTVIRSFFKPIKYMEDPYERAHQMETQRSKKEKSLEAEASFKLNLHPRSTFDKERTVFGSDVEFPEKKPREPKFNIFKHQTKWKVSSPNKGGLYGYFSPFPAYKEDPPKEKVRLPKEQTKKQEFRRMSIANSKPSPSIAYHPQNLIRTISHSVSYRQ